jgi:hypothetical protein
VELLQIASLKVNAKAGVSGFRGETGHRDTEIQRLEKRRKPFIQ